MAARKVMPPILLYWLITWEVSVSGMALEVELSHQYPITFCCRVTDGSRGAVSQNGIWHGSAYEAKVWHWIPLRVKKWHPLAFINAFWTFLETNQRLWAQWGSGWCISVVMTEMWKTRHILDGHAQLSHHKMKSILISSSTQIDGLWPGNCTQS